MPDNVLGERSCAFVIPRTGNDSVTLEEIQDFLRSLNVTPYKLPERVEIVNDFPMTPTGKVRKEDLRMRINKLIALGGE
jgi:non-ribosomal peptide synthetase component E (peptide arylation enzyme)